jgi:hypothetical protein
MACGGGGEAEFLMEPDGKQLRRNKGILFVRAGRER